MTKGEFCLDDCDFNWENHTGRATYKGTLSQVVLSFDRWVVSQDKVPRGKYPQAVLEGLFVQLRDQMAERLTLLHELLEGADFQRQCEFELVNVPRTKATRPVDYNEGKFNPDQINCLKLTLRHRYLSEPVVVELRIGKENFPVMEKFTGQYCTDTDLTGSSIAHAFDVAYQRVRAQLTSERDLLQDTLSAKGPYRGGHLRLPGS